MKHGDFTELADNYAKYRPGYSPFALDAFLALAAAQSGGGSQSALTQAPERESGRGRSRKEA